MGLYITYVGLDSVYIRRDEEGKGQSSRVPGSFLYIQYIKRRRPLSTKGGCLSKRSASSFPVQSFLNFSVAPYRHSHTQTHTRTHTRTHTHTYKKKYPMKYNQQLPVLYYTSFRAGCNHPLGHPVPFSPFM